MGVTGGSDFFACTIQATTWRGAFSRYSVRATGALDPSGILESELGFVLYVLYLFSFEELDRTITFA